MKLRIIREHNLKVPGTAYLQGIVDTISLNNRTIKFKRVSIRRNKKAISEFYGELVYFENESDIKVILPIDQTVETAEVLRVRRGDFFMGTIPVILSNPREIKYSKLVLLDITLEHRF